MEQEEQLIEKPPYVFEMVKQAVKNNFLFRHLQDEELLKVVERLREVRKQCPGRAGGGMCAAGWAVEVEEVAQVEGEAKGAEGELRVRCEAYGPAHEGHRA